MKAKETYARCEHCDKLLPEGASKESYESGRININTGMMLLPEKIAQQRTKPGYSVSHAISLSGVYCGPKCLMDCITKALKPDTGKKK